MSIARSLPLAFLYSVLPLGARAQASPTQNSLRIGLLTPSDAASHQLAASAIRGVRLGAAEARQTARLFGEDVELYEEKAATDVSEVAARLLSRRGVQVLIGTTAEDADALSRFAEAHHILFFNIAARSPSLRAACRRYTFHTEASEAMYANAVRWDATAPGAIPHRRSAGTDSVVLWEPTLQRYGASQINHRYREKYGALMNGPAWAGWVAVKIVAEAVLRSRSHEAGKLLAYLETPTTQFDGHKGWPLSFRTAEHQLRQPLYVIPPQDSRSGARQLSDVPELRAISSEAETPEDSDRAKRLLDRLIASPTAPRCAWTTP